MKVGAARNNEDVHNEETLSNDNTGSLDYAVIKNQMQKLENMIGDQNIKMQKLDDMIGYHGEEFNRKIKKITDEVERMAHKTKTNDKDKILQIKPNI